MSPTQTNDELNWSPDEELRALASGVLADEVARLGDSSTSSVEGALTALEAAGTLASLDLADDARRVASASVAALQRTLPSAAIAALDDAAIVILRDAPLCITLDPESAMERLRELLDALRVRDRAELVLLGAETLGVRDSVGDEFLASCWSFDDVVEPELWQLASLRRLRNVEIEWVAPRHRARFWWRTRHDDLSSRQLQQLAEQAPLGGPASKQQLERRSSSTIRAIVTSRSAGGLQLAAAAKGQRVELGTADGLVDLGMRGSELVLDVLVDVRPGRAPRVELDGELLTVVAEPDAEQRWVAELGVDGPSRAGLVVVIPTTHGDRTVTLEDLVTS